MNKMKFLEIFEIIAKKLIIFFVFFAFISCSLYETPELPDINRKSFSYKDIIKKKEALNKRRANKADIRTDGAKHESKQ